MPSPTDHNLTALPTKTVKPTRRRQTRHFTQLDQVTQLVAARDADPDLGFMARLLALCSLPRHQPKKPARVLSASTGRTRSIWWPVAATNSPTAPCRVCCWRGCAPKRYGRNHPSSSSAIRSRSSCGRWASTAPAATSTPDFGIRCGGCLGARSRCSTRMRAGKPR